MQQKKSRGVEENEIEDETLAQAKIDICNVLLREKKILSKIGQSAKKTQKFGKKERRRRTIVDVFGQSRSRKNSNPIEFHGWSRSKPMISPRDIDTNVEVVESRAVESSTWLERGRKPAQTRYAISFVRAQTETR